MPRNSSTAPRGTGQAYTRQRRRISAFPSASSFESRLSVSRSGPRPRLVFLKRARSELEADRLGVEYRSGAVTTVGRARVSLHAGSRQGLDRARRAERVVDASRSGIAGHQGVAGPPASRSVDALSQSRSVSRAHPWPRLGDTRKKARPRTSSCTVVLLREVPRRLERRIRRRGNGTGAGTQPSWCCRSLAPLRQGYGSQQLINRLTRVARCVRPSTT